MKFTIFFIKYSNFLEKLYSVYKKIEDIFLSCIKYKRKCIDGYIQNDKDCMLLHTFEWFIACKFYFSSRKNFLFLYVIEIH